VKQLICILVLKLGVIPLILILGLEFYNVDVDPAFASISSFSPNVGVGAFIK
jgi:hypothetical protein